MEYQVEKKMQHAKDAGILRVICAVQRNPSNFAMLGMGYGVEGLGSRFRVQGLGFPQGRRRLDHALLRGGHMKSDMILQALDFWKAPFSSMYVIWCVSIFTHLHLLICIERYTVLRCRLHVLVFSEEPGKCGVVASGNRTLNSHGTLSF